MLAEGARLAAADGIGVRVFGPERRARPRRRRGDRGGPDRGVDRQRRGPGAGGPRQARGLGRARRPRRRRGTPPTRWSAPARPGRRWRRRPSACGASRACSGRRWRCSCRSRANRCSSSTSAPTSRSAPSTWSSSPSSAPPSAPRCSRSSSRPVGLLTVGEEAGKGREEVVEAHRLLRGRAGIEFAGNVEGRDLPAADGRRRRHRRLHRQRRPEADGGHGASTVAGAVGDAARSNPVAALGGLLLKPALGGLRRELHPDTTGGAILLGLRGIAVVGHGSAGAEGIANAVRLAARCAEVDAVGRTAALLREGGAGRGALGGRGERVIGRAG